MAMLVLGRVVMLGISGGVSFPISAYFRWAMYLFQGVFSEGRPFLWLNLRNEAAHAGLGCPRKLVNG